MKSVVRILIMQLTKHTDLALRVLIYLACKPNEKVTIGDVAETYDVSKNHLVKVVHRLSQLNYIDTVQGKGGGISLSKNPKKLLVGQIVRDMENNLEMVNCQAENCPLILNCLLKKALAQASNVFIKKLNDYTVHDIVQNLGKARSIFPTSVITGKSKSKT